MTSFIVYLGMLLFELGSEVLNYLWPVVEEAEKEIE